MNGVLSVFNLLSTFKYIKKEKYIVSKEDNDLLIQYWKAYKIYKVLKISDFRNAVVNYSVIKNVTFSKACDEMCEKLKL